MLHSCIQQLSAGIGEKLEEVSPCCWPSPYDEDTVEAAIGFLKHVVTWDEATGQIRDIPDNEYIERGVRAWFRTMKSGKVLGVEKSRRLVYSWIFCALDVWDAGRRRCNIVQGGKDYDKASDFIWRCWFIYTELSKRNPSWNLPAIAKWGNPLAMRLDKIAFANGSIVEPLNSNGESFRGSGYTRVKLEELSSYAHINTVVSQALAVTMGPPAEIRGHVVIVANASVSEQWQELKAKKGEDPQTILNRRNPIEEYEAKSGISILRIHYGADPEKDEVWAAEEFETGWSQEQWDLEMEMLDSQAPGALWDRITIDRDRVEAPYVPNDEGSRSVTAIDPATTSGENADETGRVTVTKDKAGHFYVRHSEGKRDKPKDWATKGINDFYRYKCSCIVAEVNQGGDMVEHTIHTVEKVPVRMVRAKVGKKLRAQPVAALYAKGLVHHVGKHPKLETQMVTWQPGDPDSPDLLDALVYAIYELDPTVSREKKKTTAQPGGYV